MQTPARTCELPYTKMYSLNQERAWVICPGDPPAFPEPDVQAVSDNSLSGGKLPPRALTNNQVISPPRMDFENNHTGAAESGDAEVW